MRMATRFGNVNAIFLADKRDVNGLPSHDEGLSPDDPVAIAAEPESPGNTDTSKSHEKEALEALERAVESEKLLS